MSDTIMLGDSPLTLETVYQVAHGAKILLGDKARARVQKARDLIEEKAAGDVPVYGVTTGFGALAEVKVAPDQLKALQRLDPAPRVLADLSRLTRAMMLLRAQTLEDTAASGPRDRPCAHYAQPRCPSGDSRERFGRGIRRSCPSCSPCPGYVG